MARISTLVVDALSSLKLSIVCLAALMVLVVACTLAQVHMGTLGAVDAYIRAFVVWYDLPSSVYSIPVFPGGATVGLVLGANLLVAQLRRLELSWKKSGLWIIHAGLILLFVGEFVTGTFQKDMRLAIEEGETKGWIESPREHELAVIDVTDPNHDDVYGVPQELLREGGRVELPGTPLALEVRRFFPNAEIGMRGQGGPPPLADQGLGPQVAVRELPIVTADDELNLPAAVVHATAGGKSLGTWVVSGALGAPQQLVHDGRTYVLSMRHRREFLPFTLTLKDFRHDVYPGTQIPKNFSSLVHLSNPSRGEERDVLVYMNQPLRYDGRAFYQASFGKGDTLSVLQVVENPGWLLPYVSCVLVTIGLVAHFALSLRRAMRKRQERQTAPAAAEMA